MLKFFRAIGEELLKERKLEKVSNPDYWRNSFGN